jgi:hypothetical protein
MHRYRNVPFQRQNRNGLRNGIDKYGKKIREVMETAVVAQSGPG